MKTFVAAALIAATTATGAFAMVDHDNLRNSVGNAVNAGEKADDLTLSQITRLKFLAESGDSTARQAIKNILKN